MSAIDAPAEVVAPNDVSSLIRKCKAIILGATCGRDASFRLLLACRTCGLSSAAPLCDPHERCAFSDRLVCRGCNHPVDIVGLEEL